MTTKFQILCCCIKCRQETTSGQLTRNHSKKCPTEHRPVKFSKNTSRVAWNKGLSCDTDDRVKRNTEAMIETKKKLPVTGCFAWSSEKRSVVAKQRGFGGYRPNAGRSKKFKVLDSFGKETTLQSTYELQCSKILTELDIKWIRPKALKYDGRNYFADFYLPDYDVYLDPKNNYKAKLDVEKIRKVIAQNDVRLYVLLQEQITKEYIKCLCS